MTQRIELDRRAFLRRTGLTAMAGAMGSGMLGAASHESFEPADEPFDFDVPYDRSNTDCYKWDRQYERFGRENIQIGMGIADMDFKAPPCVTEALADRCRHENWGYMMSPKSYVDAIVSWNKTRHGLEVDPDSIRLSAGVHDALVSALRTFSPPGSRVLLTSPNYNAFYSTDLRYSNTTAAESPMILENGRYRIDWDDLESRIGPDTHSLILCNPQNPTGNCWSQEDLLRLGQLCLERRVVVLSDEIHCDFVMKGQKYVPFASLPDPDVVANSITFKAVSKTFSLAAMKSAYFFSTNPDYLEKMRYVHMTINNTLGVVANEAAYREGAAWFDQLLPYIEGNHDYVETYVQDNMPLVDYTKAQGTYLAWLDVSPVVDRIGAKQTASAETESSGELVTPEMIVERWFVENAGVQVNPGHTYGTGGAGRMRMNLGTSRKLIALALDNMATALAKL